MAATYDFDRARAARRADGPVLRAFGEDVRLPTAMPCALILMRARWSAETSVTIEMTVEQLRTMVGDRIDRWMADNPDLDLDDLAELVGVCVRLVNGQEPPAPEVLAPAPGAPPSGSSTSLSSGRSSKPTSSGTTASPSRKRSSKRASPGGGSKR